MSGKRVYIGRLPHDSRERDLERFFQGFGRISDVLIGKGYGFVEFEDRRDAEDAIDKKNGERLLGARVVVEMARRPPRPERSRSSRFGIPTRTRHRLLVENLSSRVDWRELKDYMRKAGGEVTFADAHRNRTNQGVVEFANRADMKKAIKVLDDTELNGRRIRLTEDGGGGGGGRSRSRSISPRRSVSRSRSPRSRTRSPRGRKSPSRSISASRSRSRSPSPVPEKGRGRGRGRDRDRSRSKSGGGTRSRSRSTSRS